MQIHDLGLEKFSTENAQRIRNIIGEYVEIEKGVEDSSSYIRLKVC